MEKNTDTELSEQEMLQIINDGIAYCNEHHKGGSRTYSKCHESYVSGAMAERIKAKKLVEEAELKAEMWERALCSLTPGGSEFAGDPEYCVRVIREQRMTQHQLLVDTIKELKAAKEALNNYNQSK